MFRRLFCLFFCVIPSLFLQAQIGLIKVSPNNQYLTYDDGRPFFWLGDTGWELFHRLNLKEAEVYLENRRSKGFNVIQAVALAEFNGLDVPNRNGDLPFSHLDPTKPNEAYFKFMDSVILIAGNKGMHIGLLPTWGDKVTEKWGAGPVVFNDKNAYQYAYWLANRYKSFDNIIWILGGDRPPKRDSSDWTSIWRSMAQGINEATAGKAFITYHTWGGKLSTSQHIHQEPWLMMNSMQSGHGGGRDVPVWELVQRDRSYLPTKPTLDMEPNYEDHPVNPWPTWNPANGYFRDYDIRKQCYRSVFSGAAGVTYGHHSIWQFWSPLEEKINFADRYWTEALDRPGAYQVGYLKRLILSRPSLDRIPDQSIIVSGQGVGGEYATAFRDSAGTYLMVYLPVGKTIDISLVSIKAKKLALTWFNPRSGTYGIPEIIKRRENLSVSPPVLGVENDWVLVIDRHQ
jgi:hypothetical protein